MVTLAPVGPAVAAQGSVPGSTASSWQTNGVVRAVAYANGMVYLGGDFTSVRPPGSAAGSGEVARNRIAAFNATTGALVTSFNPNLNGAVRALKVNPAGTTLYAGGDFTTVGSTARTRVASFNTSTGALTTWAPSVDYRVNSLAAGTTGVYIGGGFGRVNNVPHLRLARVNPTTGALVASFSPSADSVVYALALSADESKVYAGGAFLSVNGDTTYHGAAALDASNGSLLPLPARSVIPEVSAACSSVVKVIQTAGDSIYFGNEGTGGGCFDGTFAANQSDGSLKWISKCLGATQGLVVVGDLLYTGSHSHDCSGDQPDDPDAFGEIGWSKGLSRHLLARSTVDGHVANWYPNTNGGTGEGLGPRTFATDGTQLFVGGEFTSVNNVSQQGFTRFSPSASPNAVPARPATPVAVARGGGKVSVFVQAPLDLDDTDLVLRLYRDGGTTPIASAPVHSLFWRQPVAGFEDNGQTVGTRHTYSIDVAQANGTGVSPRATSAQVTVVNNAPSYQAAVEANSPSLYWRLGEAAGPVAADRSASLDGGSVGRDGVTFNVAGAVPGDTAVTTNGTTGYITSETAQPSPTTYSVEAWVKTTTTSGGRILGFGNSRGGLDFGGNPVNSSSYDKQLYMTNDGRVSFGVYAGGFSLITTPGSYNDGSWHHVVGTQGAGGMTLYVDGVRQGRNGQTANQSYTGFWRLGGDSLNSWPNQPTSNYLAGSIDEAAVYPTALAATDVVAHYNASGRTAVLPTLPTDTYGASVVADSPSAFWRLDEASGSTAADSSGNGNDATVIPTVTRGAAGGIGGFGTAATFDGASGNVVSSSSTTVSAYSTELWFKSASTSGGKLIGFGNAQTGNSGSYDKHVYLTNDGRLQFGVYNGGFDIVSSAAGFNDNAWHQVVATQGADGMKLYVDNQLVGSNAIGSSQGYTGYWRVGGDNLGGWPDRPASDYAAATIDDVAIYDSVLPASDVTAHWTASGR